MRRKYHKMIEYKLPVCYSIDALGDLLSLVRKGDVIKWKLEYG